MYLSDKNSNVMEMFNLMAKPMLGNQDDNKDIASSDDKELQQEQEMQTKNQHDQQKENKCNSWILDANVQFSKDSKLEDDQEVHMTPKSTKKKISEVLACPPAPKKPKSLPSTKRKASSRQLMYLDLSSEVESMFPPALRADLKNKIKKARQES